MYRLPAPCSIARRFIPPAFQQNTYVHAAKAEVFGQGIGDIHRFHLGYHQMKMFNRGIGIIQIQRGGCNIIAQCINLHEVANQS